MGNSSNARRYGHRGGWQQAQVPDTRDIAEWFSGRLPDDWFTTAPTIEVDREEILVIGSLPTPEDASPAAVDGRVSRFREATRTQRMRIADEAETRYGRKLAWGVTVDDTRVLFTHLAVPVMTRLRQPERKVLDTLVDAGVARSRSDALAWTVRLAGEHADQWLTDLRDAMRTVEDLRTEGPRL